MPRDDRGTMNRSRINTGEFDGLMFTSSDQDVPVHVHPDETKDALVSCLKRVEAQRKPLRAIVADVIAADLRTRAPIQLSEPRSALFRGSGFVRLIVDLWSNSDEEELLGTVRTVRSLFKGFRRGTSVDTLACVYGAAPNKRAYAALRNSIVFGETRLYGISHAPRLESLEDRCEAIVGLRSSVLAFLST